MCFYADFKKQFCTDDIQHVFTKMVEDVDVFILCRRIHFRIAIFHERARQGQEIITHRKFWHITYATTEQGV